MLGVVQGSFRATLGVASVFVDVVSRPGWGACGSEMFSPSPSGLFFGVILDYLDFSGGTSDNY